MPHYEYKVIPAPTRADKVRGVKTPEGRFAQTVESELNRMGAAGWEYQRAELLPSEERSGLTGSVTNWRTVLVFRRQNEAETEALHPRVLDPVYADPAPTPPLRTDIPATDPDLPQIYGGAPPDAQAETARDDGTVIPLLKRPDPSAPDDETR